MMQTKFPWYAIHKDTKHIVAAFNEEHDAQKFCAMFAHGMYVVRDLPTVAILHDA